MHSRSVALLVVLAPTVQFSGCRPISDEIALTNMVAMPIAFIVALTLLAWVRRLWDRSTSEPDDARRQLAGQGLVLLAFAAAAALASTSSSFEDDAFVAVTVMLAAAMTCATLFTAWATLPPKPESPEDVESPDSASPRAPHGAWTALATCTAFELLLVAILLLDGEAAEGLASLTIMIEVCCAGSGLVIVPAIVIGAAVGGRPKLDDAPE